MPSKYLDLLNAEEWASVTTKSREAAGLPPLEMAQDLANKEDNDWQDIMFNPALMQNYNLSVKVVENIPLIIPVWDTPIRTGL